MVNRNEGMVWQDPPNPKVVKFYVFKIVPEDANSEMTWKGGRGEKSGLS